MSVGVREEGKCRNRTCVTETDTAHFRVEQGFRTRTVRRPNLGNPSHETVTRTKEGLDSSKKEVNPIRFDRIPSGGGPGWTGALGVESRLGGPYYKEDRSGRTFLGLLGVDTPFRNPKEGFPAPTLVGDRFLYWDLI